MSLAIPIPTVDSMFVPFAWESHRIPIPNGNLIPMAMSNVSFISLLTLVTLLTLGVLMACSLFGRIRI